jgi:hypothetical protein
VLIAYKATLAFASALSLEKRRQKPGEKLASVVLRNPGRGVRGKVSVVRAGVSMGFPWIIGASHLMRGI